MEYAIIETGGKQYKVSQGQELSIDKIDGGGSDKFVTSKVLLVRNDQSIIIGQPYVANGQVIGKIIGQVKGDKIRVSKFKAKVRYRKTIGFRPLFTKIIIEKINTTNGKSQTVKTRGLTRVKK